MKFNFSHTSNLFLITNLLLLLSMTPAKAQTVVHQGEVTTLSVAGMPGYFYQWDLYTDASLNFATVPGNCPDTSAKFINGNQGSQITVQWLKTGIYFFKITANDPIHCAMNLKIGMIKVIPPEIEAIILGDSIIGACQHIKLDASKSIGNISKYEWVMLTRGGILTNSTGAITEFSLSSSFSGSLPAIFKIGLKITDSQGKTSSDTLSVKVEAMPVAKILTNDKIEKDGAMTIDGSASAGNAINFRWFTDAGKIIGSNEQSAILVNGPGVYSLEVTDIHGCVSKKSVNFPPSNIIIANKDYGRTSWEKDITIPVLANDYSSNNNLNPGSLKISTPPSNGVAVPNKDGTITYHPTINKAGNDQFTYEVCDFVGFCDSAYVIIDIYDPDLKIPEAFSPNGDGQNETLLFQGLESYPQSQLYVYTRAGQLVYQSPDYKNDWDGKNIKRKEILPIGTYYYILKLGGTNRSVKGFVFIKY